MTFYSNNYHGRQLRLEVWQDGTAINWRLYVEGGNTQYYTVYNLNININGVEVYRAGTVSASTRRFPAAVGDIGGTIYVNSSASPFNINVHFTGTVFNNNSNQYGGSFTVNPTIFRADVSSINIADISDIGVYLSFHVTNSHGENPTAPYIDIFEDTQNGFKRVISDWGGWIGGLEPDRVYHVRANCRNSAGITYTNWDSFRTKFIYPSSPRHT